MPLKASSSWSVLPCAENLPCSWSCHVTVCSSAPQLVIAFITSIVSLLSSTNFHNQGAHNFILVHGTLPASARQSQMKESQASNLEFHHCLPCYIPCLFLNPTCGVLLNFFIVTKFIRDIIELLFPPWAQDQLWKKFCAVFRKIFKFKLLVLNYTTQSWAIIAFLESFDIHCFLRPGWPATILCMDCQCNLTLESHYTASQLFWTSTYRASWASSDLHLQT